LGGKQYKQEPPRAELGGVVDGFRNRFLVLTFLTFLLGAVLPVLNAIAGHLQDCATTSFTWGDDHRGSDVQNHCNGGSGYDHIFGYGASDELYGGPGGDRMRGATGDDELRDVDGNSDEDKVCFGDGSDLVNVDDGDTKDVIWDTPFPDGETERFICDCAGGAPDDEIKTSSQECPLNYP
jgi:hypothetical protein